MQASGVMVCHLGGGFGVSKRSYVEKWMGLRPYRRAVVFSTLRPVSCHSPPLSLVLLSATRSLAGCYCLGLLVGNGFVVLARERWLGVARADFLVLGGVGHRCRWG